MSTELISVICTVKNGEKTISKTIDSIINQTYNNWELVIVDDGSTDKTVDLIKYYEISDDRIKLIESKSIGRGKALNLAIENTDGTYICNIDSDDLMHPEKLKIQIKCINNHSDYFLLSTLSEIIFKNGKPTWEEYDEDKLSIIKVNSSILVNNNINHSSVIMKKDVLLELGGYDETRTTQFDYELWLRAFIKNKKMGVINNVLTAKRIHVDQSFENKRRIKYLYNSMVLQLRSIFLYKREWLYLAVPPIRFIFGLLPFRLRRLISRIIKK